MTYAVAVLIGSLRKDSINRKVAGALMKLSPPTLKFSVVAIDDLPLYNADLEKAPPAPWTRVRGEIQAADAVLFVTPEYNRSAPGVLKNAIDVASRPYGQNSFAKKPAAVVSASPGAMGGFGANHHLRQSLVFLDMPTMQQPEAYLGHADKLIGDDGGPADANTEKFLRSIIDAFAAWVATHVTA